MLFVRRPDTRPAATIPDHALIEPIASGAYGEVWLARNSLGTLRAVKIVRRAAFDDDRPYEREFAGIQKFEPISRSHEGFVDLLQVGRNDTEGYFYYVMELADAGSEEWRVTSDKQGIGASALRSPRRSSLITDHLSLITTYAPRTLAAEVKARGALPLEECLGIARTLASALAELHDHGLVHRDIKPSNIIFVGGVPKLADIGLVAAANEARSFVGTEGFIPPEGPGTPRADLYSLGIVLYVISTGKSHRDFPEPPADLASRPDRERWLELQAIIHRACQADPRQRYESAGKMLEDLRRLGEGGSVRRWHAWQRNVKYAMRVALPLGALVITSAIVISLATRSPRSSGFKQSPVAEANDEYKRGINELHLNLNAVEAIKHFETAVQLDPKFADAHGQLAEAWFSIPGEASSRNGQQAAQTAVALDPRSGLARVAFAAAKLFTLDFPAAERESKHAVRLSPETEQVLLMAALNLAALGRTHEALDNLKRANEIGRDTPSKLRVIYSGFVYGWCRDYDRAIALYNATPWLKDAVDSPHYMQARFYLAKGDYANSMRLGRQSALERGIDPDQVNAEFDALETAFKQGGPERYWRERLAVENSKAGNHNWMNLAAIHAQLNQPDKVFEYLRLARQETPAYFAIEINTDANFDSLRNDSRFRELMAELWLDR